MRQAWHVLEPKQPLVWGWALDAVCEHLEAVTFGHIRNLIINIPPRNTKSLSASVMWPAWEWGPQNNPHLRYLYSSYAMELSTRDSMKTRNLIQSAWYQSRWGDRFSIVADENRKTRFSNDKTGYRLATSVDAFGTGEGGDRVVVDDPHNTKGAESTLKRIACLTWWDETMPTRVTDPKKTAFVVIMQRLHEQDLTGHILAKEHDYCHLCLPARYEGETKKRLHTAVPLDPPFKDPRTQAGDGEKTGEPLSDRFDEEVLLALRKKMTAYAWAGQQQQRPAPRGGGIFKIEGFRLITRLPNPVHVAAAVRYWDKAGTEDDGAYTAGVLMWRTMNGRFVVVNVVRGQWSYARREARIEQCADLDDAQCLTRVWVEQEPGSGGKESAERTVKTLISQGHSCKAERVTGDKVTRSEPYQLAIENGMVDVFMAPWTQAFIDEHETAPNGKYKDQWDSAGGAYNKLALSVKRAGAW